MTDAAGYPRKTDPLLLLLGLLIALIGAGLAGGGTYLAILGGSWYYGLAGLGLFISGVLLARRQRAGALWYAVVFIATLLWAAWESGLNYWRWIPRLDMVLILAILVALLAPRLGFARRPSYSLAALLFLGLAIWAPGEGFDADSLTFQLTMPGLDEEIFYRGVLLLMLNEAFGRPVRVLGAPMGWGAVLSSLAFGLTHALGYADGAFTFEPLLMASTGVSALLLVWLREKTGSVLLPVLLHNYGNAIFMLV
mgnify:CR=1 FL=1